MVTASTSRRRGTVQRDGIATNPEALAALRDWVAPDWVRWAACGNADPDLFWSLSPHSRETARALRYCADCPVRWECGDDADRTGAEGVWGGIHRTSTVARRRYDAWRARHAHDAA